MSQNKELKVHLAELQDAFVRLSQQNMELASDLETSRHRVGQLEALLREAGQVARSPRVGCVSHCWEVVPPYCVLANVRLYKYINWNTRLVSCGVVWCGVQVVEASESNLPMPTSVEDIGTDPEGSRDQVQVTLQTIELISTHLI